MKLRALIVDDEAPARKKIRHFLEMDPEIGWIGECADGQEALKSMQQHDANLLFLDVQMPLIDGFTFLKRSGKERTFHVIFVTAYDEYALKAFEESAADYLLKPFIRKRFEDAVRKVKQQIHLKQQAEPLEQAMAILNQVQEKSSYLQRIAIKQNQAITFLSCRDIDWIESKDNYVLIHAAKKEHLIRETLNVLERLLDPAGFLRVHRRILVNTECISEMRQSSGTQVILKNGSALPVSRRLKDKVKRFLLNRKP